MSLADARALIQIGDQVVVPRLGYDRPGRVVKLDHEEDRQGRDRSCDLGCLDRGVDAAGTTDTGGGGFCARRDLHREGSDSTG